MLKVASFNIFPAYNIPDQIRRRVDANADSNSLNILSELHAQYGSKAGAQYEYNMVLSDICKFSAAPDGYEVPVVDISDEDDVNGVHNIKRYNSDSKIYNFVTELVISSPNAMSLIETTYIVSGYTSEAEPSFTGLLPDEMVLFINEIHGIQKVFNRSPTGSLIEISSRSVENYVLASVLESVTPGHRGILGGTELVINPASIAASGALYADLDINADENVIGDAQLRPKSMGAMIYDTSITKPENLFGTIANAYSHHHANVDSGDDFADRLFNSPTTSVNQYVRSNRLVNNFSSHAFANALTAGLRRGMVSERQATEIQSSAKFRLADLRAALENGYDLDMQISDAILQTRRSMDRLSTDESTDTWVGNNGYSTQGSLIAFDIAMRIGSIMSSNLIGAVQFGYDTRRADALRKAELFIVNESVRSISKSGLSRLHAERFAAKVEEMMLQVTSHNRIPLEVVVKTVLGSVSRIEIRLEGEIMERYTHASFMSNRLHLGLTNDTGYINEISKSAAGLYSAISEGFKSFDIKGNLASIGDYLPQSSTTAPSPSLGTDIGLNNDTLSTMWD